MGLRISPTLKQTWCATSILIGIFGQGMMLGHTGSILSGLQQPDSPIQMNIHSITWLASAPGVFSIFGSAASCYLMNRYGRRWAFLISLIPGGLSWIVLHYAQSYTLLFICRAVAGATGGAVTLVGAIILGEYTSPGNRAMFLTIKTAAIILGSTCSHILGFYMNWRTIALVPVGPHVISFLIAITCPESPPWLASKKRFEECEKHFYWLRGDSTRSTRELIALVKSQKERLFQPKEKSSFVNKMGQLSKKFRRKDFLKPLFNLIVALVLMEASGRHFFPTYAVQIVTDALNAESLPYYSTICIDIIIVVSAMISSMLIRMMKVRMLLFSTGVASLAVLFTMVIYLFLIAKNIVSNDYPWIITIMFILYFFLANLGCSSIPVALQGELFPLQHRESGSAIINVSVAMIFVGVVTVIPHLLLSTKVYGTFAILGGIMTVTLLILYYTLPETKDRTLQEIEDYFNHGKFIKDDVNEEDLVNLDEDQVV